MPEETAANAAATPTTAPGHPAGQDADPGDGSLPAWVTKRMEQKERSLLRDLGYADAAEAKAIKAERDALLEKSKSAEQKAAEEVDDLRKAKAERDSLREELTDYARLAMERLDPEMREIIEATHPKSPARQLALMERLLKRDQAKQPAAAEPAKPRPAPASTTAAVDAPNGASTSPVNHRAEFERLKTVDEYKARKYLLLHRDEILSTPNS